MWKKRGRLEDLLSLRELKFLCIISYILIVFGMIFSYNIHLRYPNSNSFILALLILALFSFSIFIARKTQLKIEKEKEEFQHQELKEIFRTRRIVRYKNKDEKILKTPLQSLLLDLQDMECFESEAYLEGDIIYVVVHANNKFDSISFTNYRVFFDNFEIIK